MGKTSKDISLSGERLCAHPDCKKTLVQKPSESNFRFTARRHCSMLCSNTNPHLREPQKEKSRAQREAFCKECPICHKTYSRKKGETSTAFEVRLTCSQQCADENRKRRNREEAKKEGKKCEVCGEMFYRRVSAESITRFQKRKTCGTVCGHGVKATPRKARARVALKKHKLRVVPPLPREIPEAPPTQPLKVWRPKAWGG